MTTNKRPGRLAHSFAIILTLLLVLTLAASCLTWQFHHVLTSADLHASIALHPSVLDAQMARIESVIHTLAEQYHFAPDTVTSIVNRDAVAEYNRDVIDWWMALPSDNPVLSAPVWDASSVETAVREDPFFQENTPAARRRSIARDNIAYEIGQAVTRAVLPVRTQLLSLALPIVLQRIDLPHYVRLLSLAPQLCAVVSVALLVLIALLMMRRIAKALMYWGSALAASALTLLAFGVVLWRLDLISVVAEVSPLLAMQLDLLCGHMALQLGVIALVLLAAGLALIGVHQHQMNRAKRQRGNLTA